MAKILVIEDTENNRIIIERRLRKKDHEVHLREDAEQGITAAGEIAPDIILMDVGLPGMDGWTAARLLKDNPATAGTPIIALTAHAMEGDREKALAAGCDDYETKPIDFPALYAKIDALTKPSLSP
ncbi:MAG: response regulator [Verrucomicrobiae bacterium]|nr:response regulator [Verrucomicrobiae bacterium]